MSEEKDQNLVDLESDGGTFRVRINAENLPESHRKAIAGLGLAAVKRAYADRVRDGGPAIAEDGTGAVEEPPANIIATKDPDGLNAEGTPHAQVSIGGTIYKFPDHDKQWAGWYDPDAEIVIATFQGTYKRPQSKG